MKTHVYKTVVENGGIKIEMVCGEDKDSVPSYVLCTHSAVVSLNPDDMNSLRECINELF